MKKEKMITRTITTSTVHTIGINTSTMKAMEMDFNFTGTFKGAGDALKAVQMVPTDGYRVADVLFIDVSEALYGMPESVFIQYAEIMPPRSATARE